MQLWNFMSLILPHDEAYCHYVIIFFYDDYTVGGTFNCNNYKQLWYHTQ